MANNQVIVDVNPSSSCHWVLPATVSVIAAVILWSHCCQKDAIVLDQSQNQQEAEELSVCTADVLNNGTIVCRPRCKIGSGSFSLPGMNLCRPWLSCDDIRNHLILHGSIGNGSVKQVHLGTWKNYSMSVSVLRDRRYLIDFLHGLEMLKAFSGADNVVQLLGFCLEDYLFLTEYHPLGNILDFLLLWTVHSQLRLHDTVNTRFRMCLDYAQTIAFLHDSPLGTKVMCDSSQLAKVLHQYLVTKELRIVVSDLDALPSPKVVCGQRMLTGELLAPEQRWTLWDEAYSRDKMIPYDEKVDIWKIPDVCGHLLGPYGDGLQYELFDIHKRCKNADPTLRPNAQKVVEEYERIFRILV